MPDIVVTVPKSFGIDRWIDEGQLPGEEWNGLEYHFYLWGTPPIIQRGERVYVVYNGALRGYAPLVRIDRWESGRYGLVRHGGAVAVTIPEYIRGFRGFRYVWWNHNQEISFPEWQDPDARYPERWITKTGETFEERARYHRRGELSPGEHALAKTIREGLQRSEEKQDE